MAEDHHRIETERLSMRPLCLDDGPYIEALQNDALILRYHFKGKRYDRDTIAQKLTAWTDIYDQRGYGFVLIFEKGKPEADGFVGKAALWNVDELGADQLEVAYLLLERCRGKGYATETARGLIDHAFDALDRDSIVALIEPDNEPSKRVAARAGFVFEDRRVLPSRGEMDYEIYRLHRRVASNSRQENGQEARQ